MQDILSLPPACQSEAAGRHTREPLVLDSRFRGNDDTSIRNLHVYISVFQLFYVDYIRNRKVLHAKYRAARGSHSKLGKSYRWVFRRSRFDTRCVCCQQSAWQECTHCAGNHRNYYGGRYYSCKRNCPNASLQFPGNYIQRTRDKKLRGESH